MGLKCNKSVLLYFLPTLFEIKKVVVLNTVIFVIQTLDLNCKDLNFTMSLHCTQNSPFSASCKGNRVLTLNQYLP